MNTMPRLRRLALALALAVAALASAGPRAVASIDGVDTSTDQLWAAIKGDTYDQRAHFADGANRMLAKLDEQIQALKAKRAAMTTDTTDWDIAMKEVDGSRVLLAGRMNELAKTTTPETWADVKDKVGDAWKRSQLAVDNMNSTRTS
jgi:hypothetical protein